MPRRITIEVSIFNFPPLMCKWMGKSTPCEIALNVACLVTKGYYHEWKTWNRGGSPENKLECIIFGGTLMIFVRFQTQNGAT